MVRRRDDAWWMAAIELPTEQPSGQDAADETSPSPQKVASTGKRAPHPRKKPVICLPKGLVDPGEKPLEAALREVREETGLTASLVTKLADIKYVYVRTWGDRERVFKIVSFYLLRYESGRIDNLSTDMRIEVAQAKWIPLEEAPKLLAYRGEKQMARKALEYVNAHPELAPLE